MACAKLRVPVGFGDLDRIGRCQCGFDKDGMPLMLHALHSDYGVDFGPTRAFGRPARYCGIRPRTRGLDNELRGNHGKDNRTGNASVCRSA